MPNPDPTPDAVTAGSRRDDPRAAIPGDRRDDPGADAATAPAPDPHAARPSGSKASVAPGDDPGIAQLIAFWLDAGPSRWFTKDAAFDAEFRRRFEALHFAAARRDLDAWAAAADGAMALVLLLDQFPRNAFRGTAHMFATDPLARRVADRMIAAGFDLRVDARLRAFCYLPFQHSEILADQHRSIDLNRPLDPSSLHWAEVHAEIVERFGRFPHRNPMLGRETTAEEAAFLAGGGFAG